MAKVKIQGHATGTGIITIAAPNTNTDRTITLPDADVTLGTPEGTVIKSTGESGGTKFLREDGDGTCSWQAAGGGGGDLTKIATQSFNGSVTSITFTDCFSDTYDSYKVIVTDLRDSSSDSYGIYGLFSSDSGSSFHSDYGYIGSTQTKLRLSGSYDMGTSSAPKILHQEFLITGARDTAAYTLCDGFMNKIDNAGISDYGHNVRCSMKSKVAIDTFKIYPSNGTPDAGTVTIYGLKA